MKRITQQQLESYLWGAATLLRGTIDAGDYKQLIFPLLFYKRVCDVFDEETQAALTESGGDKDFAAYRENHRFQVPLDAHWREVRQAAKNVGQTLQSGMRAIETANPDKLYGIFGDTQWTNKDRLSDAMLRDLVEHFSTLELSVANLPEDELGQGYEYLLKKFADDSGHTAAEFYTNRTVVHLMTELLDVQPGESVYDPTCGSGGMLLSCITHLRRHGKEWRNARLYGHERNLMTSSIARMNCFLHGVEDFRIERGDTLSDPKVVQGDHLQRFDVVQANPHYSIKKWDREAFASAWDRNLYGTPPQGRADYVFWQYIIRSMILAPSHLPVRMARPTNGLRMRSLGERLAARAGESRVRCAILFPHGALFREEGGETCRRLLDADLVECVLGPSSSPLHNPSMEACVPICRTALPKGGDGTGGFIKAINDFTLERVKTLLTSDCLEFLGKAFERLQDMPGFTRVATLEPTRTEDNLGIAINVVAPPPSLRLAEDRHSPAFAALWTAGREVRRCSIRQSPPGSTNRRKQLGPMQKQGL